MVGYNIEYFYLVFRNCTQNVIFFTNPLKENELAVGIPN